MNWIDILVWFAGDFLLNVLFWDFMLSTLVLTSAYKPFMNTQEEGVTYLLNSTEIE